MFASRTVFSKHSITNWRKNAAQSEISVLICSSILMLGRMMFRRAEVVDQAITIILLKC